MAGLRLTSLLIVSLFLVGAARGVEKYEIDSAHAFVTFTVSHFAGKAKGSFSDVTGIITFDESDVTKASVEVVIKTAGIYTGNEGRDTHLRSADFFDADKFPQMTFKSKRIEKRSAGYVAVGDLNIRGVTKEVAMPFTIRGPFKDPLPRGVKRLLVESSLKIDRRDFGISWSRVTEDGGLFVGNEVTLEINIEAIVPKPRVAAASWSLQPHDRSVRSDIAVRFHRDDNEALYLASLNKHFERYWCQVQHMGGHCC